MKHTCHAWGCDAPCPQRMLMCRRCWSFVPADVQREVYRTVRLRGPAVDHTWAPWWRAQSDACRIAAEKLGVLPAERIAKLAAKDVAFADQIEARAAKPLPEASDVG